MDILLDNNEKLRGDKNMDEFKRLTEKEIMEIEGGIFGVDDVIFWGLVGAGFAAGVATGISRKNRK